MRKSQAKLFVLCIFLLVAVVNISANGQKEAPAESGEMKVITLNAASMFDKDHPYSQSYYKFEELVNKYQDEVKIELVYNLNKSLGVEGDIFRFMSQGESVDISILAPANIASRVPSIAIVDMPLLFKDVNHRNRVLASELFTEIADDIVKKANIRVIGYAGGSSRSIISNYPITNMEDLQGFKLRVQGAPIWAKVFAAVGAVPAVLAYDEVYSAVQTGVIQGLENEKFGYAQMRFFEVAPHYTVNEHSITVRPLFISEATYKKLSPVVQAAVLKAGKEAGEYASMLELDQADVELQRLVDAGLTTAHDFSDADKAEFRNRATPAIMEYVNEAGFTDLFNAIKNIQ
ncbi:MAG: TRAP transporter substrate-binding protein [Spirochaetaceae bacterium]